MRHNLKDCMLEETGPKWTLLRVDASGKVDGPGQRLTAFWTKVDVVLRFKVIFLLQIYWTATFIHLTV